MKNPAGPAALEILPAELDSPPVQELIAALNAETQERYPEPGANHFRLDAEEVRPGRGVLLVAILDGEALGCGALRRMPASGEMGQATGEIKRMYVRPGRRGHGIGAALLRALEAEARTLGLTRLVLETGERQTEAVTLYRRTGFTAVPRFGEYLDSPLSLCMAKDLGSRG